MSPRLSALADEAAMLRKVLKLAEAVRRDCVLNGKTDLLDAATEGLAKASRDYNDCCRALAECAAVEANL